MKKKLILIPILVLALVVSLVLPVAGCAGEELTLTPEMEEFIEEQLASLKGDQGEQGIQGEQGERGLQGVAGVKGSTGTTGATGAIGAIGEQGIPGLPGVGYPGATGAKGDTGNVGPEGPAFSNLGILLYVEDGTKEIAYVTYVLDEPIALEALVELTFFQELVYGGVGSGQYGANVILGIDVDGDSRYEANDLAWHFGHDSTALGDDTFIAMDGVNFYTSPKKVDALSIGKWWTPNITGDGLSIDLYCLFPELLTRISEGSWDTNVPNTSVQVSLIRLVIGGSVSWMDTAFRVTSDMIPSEVGVYP